MLWHLIATVFAGLGAAGIALLIRKLSAQRAPRWLIPVFAGLGMLGYQIDMEYRWFQHKQSQLPAGTLVVYQDQTPQPFRPWSYVFPQVRAFTVMDPASRQRQGDQVFLRLYRFERGIRDSVLQRPYLLNCTLRQLLPLDEELAPLLHQLQQLPADDPLWQAACMQSP